MRRVFFVDHVCNLEALVFSSSFRTNFLMEDTNVNAMSTSLSNLIFF